MPGKDKDAWLTWQDSIWFLWWSKLISHQQLFCRQTMIYFFLTDQSNNILSLTGFFWLGAEHFSSNSAQISCPKLCKLLSGIRWHEINWFLELTDWDFSLETVFPKYRAKKSNYELIFSLRKTRIRSLCFERNEQQQTTKRFQKWNIYVSLQLSHSYFQQIGGRQHIWNPIAIRQCCCSAGVAFYVQNKGEFRFAWAPADVSQSQLGREPFLFTNWVGSQVSLLNAQINLFLFRNSLTRETHSCQLSSAKSRQKDPQQQSQWWWPELNEI